MIKALRKWSVTARLTPEYAMHCESAQEDCGMHMSMWAAAKHILSTDAAHRMQVGDRFDAVFSQALRLCLLS